MFFITIFESLNGFIIKKVAEKCNNRNETNVVYDSNSYITLGLLLVAPVIMLYGSVIGSKQEHMLCCQKHSGIFWNGQMVFWLGEWSWSDQQWGFIHWFVLFWSHSVHLSSPSLVAASVQPNVSDQNWQQGNGNSISHVTCCSLECNPLEWWEEEEKWVS